MIKTIRKKDFTTKTMREMQSGDCILVVCDSYKELDSALSLVRLHKKRDNVNDITSQYDKDTFCMEVKRADYE